jgi:hypothetical protein
VNGVQYLAACVGVVVLVGAGLAPPILLVTIPMFLGAGLCAWRQLHIEENQRADSLHPQRTDKEEPAR